VTRQAFTVPETPASWCRARFSQTRTSLRSLRVFSAMSTDGSAGLRNPAAMPGGSPTTACSEPTRAKPVATR
jgi:hypothetical protein